MTIAFVTEYSLENASLRSGVPHHIAKAMSCLGITYKQILILDKRNVLTKAISRGKQFYYRAILKGAKGRYDSAFSRNRVKSYKKCLQNKIEDCDIVFSINPFLVASIETRKPIIFWIDNSFKSFHEHYLGNDLCKEIVQQALVIEETAFEMASQIFTASTWLQTELINQYPRFKKKFLVLPRGANLLAYPSYDLVKEQIQKKTFDKVLNILFISSGSWERKGGEIVLEIFKELKKITSTNLIVLGFLQSQDLKKVNDAGIEYLGTINKNNKQDFEKYIKVFSKSHYLVIPSKADGFGIAYAEAANFGVPSLAFGIMGVTEAIKNGITGWHLPFNSSPKDFAEIILQNWIDKKAFHSICESTYQYASINFSWQQNIEKMLSFAIEIEIASQIQNK